MVSGELLADSYAVDTTATPTGAVGKLIWNDTEGTLDLGLKGGNVTLPVGQAVAQRVTNTTGSNMTRGQVVRLAGSQGNRTTVALAQANNEAGSSKTFGVTTEAINDNHSGFVITEGLIKDLNTSSLTEGAIVWLSPSTAGGLTTTKPSAPDHGVMVGLCVRSHASVGILLVKVQNGYELEELHNVSISSPTDGQVLTYDAALTLWKNANATGGGGGASVSVGDSAPGSPSSGDLWFDSANLQTYIYYDSVWVEVAGGAGGGSGANFAISDTAPSLPGAGDTWYDSTTGRSYIYYDSQWVEMASSRSTSYLSHATEHVRGGTDPLDGDRLQVDYVPAAYTRDSSDVNAGANTDLTAHLKGIDNKVVNIGLVYVGSTTLTAVGTSGQVVSNIFSSTYDNYVIHLNLSNVSTTPMSVLMQLTSGGTPNATASSYASQTLRVESGTGTVTGVSTSTTYWPIVEATGTLPFDPKIELASPYLARATHMSASSIVRGGTWFSGTQLGYHTQAASYDGLKIYTNTGTITGTLRVYGYKN